MSRLCAVAVTAAGLSLAMLTVGSLGAMAQEASPAAESARVRVLHASPGAPAMDIYANGSAIVTEVEFGDISPYIELPAGEYQIQVVAAGADPARRAVVDDTLMLAAATATTVAATNALAAIEMEVLRDAPTPAADRTQVRIVHLSADAPAVDIAVDGEDVVLPGLTYPNASEYLDLPAAEYDLEIRPDGETTVAFDIPALDLEAGRSYSAFAIGSLASGSFTVLPTVDADLALSIAKLRVLHASPDAPAVDVYAGGDAILAGLEFGDISEYVPLPVGEQRIQVVAAGADPAAGTLIDATLELVGGSMTTVATTNSLADIEAKVSADPPAHPEDGALVRFVHMSADAPAVDIAPDDGKPLVKKLEYGGASGYLELPAGAIDLEVRPAGDRRRVTFDIPELNLEAGVSYSAFAIGSVASDSFTVLAIEDAPAGSL